VIAVFVTNSRDISGYEMPIRNLPVLLGVANCLMKLAGQYETQQCCLCSTGRHGMSYQVVLSVPQGPRTFMAPLCQSDMGMQGIRV